MSLRSRIVLLVLLAILTPAALLLFYLFGNREADIVAAKQSLGVLAAYAANDLSDKVNGTVQLLHGLSQAADLDTVDKGACSAFLGEVLKRYPQYTGLLTIRPDGQLHCDSLRTGRTLDLSDRAYFKQARASVDPAFEVVFGRLSGIAVLQVAFPAHDIRRELKYVLLASLNLAQIGARYATASPHPGMEVVIWDGKGTVMARHPDDGPKKASGSSRADSALYRFARSEKIGDTAELAGPDGTLKIWARSVLPVAAGSLLLITLGIPHDVLLAQADRDLGEALAILGIGSLLAFLGALLFAELGIRRPVARIMTAAERQRAGNPGARIGAPYPRGELGGLMAKLDTAAASVQAQQVEIERRSEELRRTNRTLRLLNAINSTIVRVHDKDELFAETCRIAAGEGHFPIVWVGLLDCGSTQVEPVAWQGVDEAYVRSIPREVTDMESLVGSVIREKRAVIVNDIASELRMVKRKAAVELGSRSVVGLPLIVSGEAAGVLVLHSREAGFFDQQEMKLLTELAGNVAFALDYLGKSEKLDYLAYYDRLTGLANRSLFLERVAQCLRGAVGGGHKLAIFLLDLERFKNINDSLGRPAGDALLMQVAQWLTRSAGDASLLARVDADHFALVLPEVKREGDLARLLDKSIAALLEHPFRLDDAVFRIAAKVGVALFPDDGADADTLFKNAEAALKKAKASGARYLFYTQAMTQAIAGNLTLENQLRRALDNGEFVLHYQPKVNLASGKLTGAEALIRWNDPRTGLVPPGRFIPVLEETGLIYEVGHWALHQAIADYLRWRDADLAAVRIAVNVSPLQLRHRGFTAEIEQAIGIDARAAAGLELELTESVIMEDIKYNIASLQAIRTMGVSIAIDDFGTGFSSLSYLAKLPADTLKIDRSFVVDMTTGPQGLALVQTIINLAHALKLNVVAEGVETEEQSRLLRLLGCDEMQGFLFSKAVLGEVFEEKFLAPPPAK
jgi:diguanylate cyclase (GGDEF)-like protein